MGFKDFIFLKSIFYVKIINMKKKLSIFLIYTFSFFCFSLSFDFNAKNIWKDNTGSSEFLSINYQDEIVKNDEIIKSKIQFSNLSSTHDFLKGNLFHGNFDIDYSKKNVKLKTKINYTTLNKFKLNVNDKIFNLNEFLNGVGIFQKIEYKISNFNVSPYFYFSNNSKTSGEFYWFNGKVGIPLFCYEGISLEYKNNIFNTFFVFGKVNALNEKTELLGNGSCKNIFVNYKRIFDFNKILFSASLGYGFGQGDFNLLLNQENQNYLLFPYVYNKIIADIFLHYLNINIDFSYAYKNFDFHINTKTLFSIYQSGNYFNQWTKKDNLFFDGSSGYENYVINFLNKKGFVYIELVSNYNFNIKNSVCKISLAKPFIIPIVFEKNNDMHINNNLIIDSLLSGFQISFKISL